MITLDNKLEFENLLSSKNKVAQQDLQEEIENKEERFQIDLI